MINIKIKEAADILNAGLWGTYDWDKPITVSYTHLDVYKRQTVYIIFFI